jgi:lipoprotein LprG
VSGPGVIPHKPLRKWKSAADLVLFILLVLLTACSQPTPESLPAAEILERSIERMKLVSGFHFLIERSGAPAYIDWQQTLSLRRMEGDYVSPDRAQANVRVIAPGIVAEIRMVSIGNIQWETNPLTGEWEQLPPDWGFNPTLLFDPQVGLQRILEQDLSNLALMDIVELEEMPGRLLYGLAGDLGGESIAEMTFGLMGPQPMQVQLWIDPESFDLYRILITEEAIEDAEPTIWQVDFWNIDDTVEIQPPPA